MGFEPTTPALRERCSGQLSYVGGSRQSSREAAAARGGTGRRPPPRSVSRDPLDRLPRRLLPGGVTLLEASTFRARLLGLALLADLPPRHALLIPSCRSVHTFGMRLRLDLVFLDRRGEPLRVVRDLAPGRLSGCLKASAVIETGAGEADLLAEALRADAAPRGC